MKRLFFLLLTFVLLSSAVCVVLAVDETKAEQKWVDITKKLLANPASKGGWTEDKEGKIYQSADGNKVKVVHSSYGTFIVELVEGQVFKIEDGKQILLDGVELLQRDFGTCLVVKTKTHKLRMKFTAQVSGMKHIKGIKGK
ncbi:hypothetical protein K8T06_12370 [bacterium]|nr:hypothetical protein [bacterium]